MNGNAQRPRRILVCAAYWRCWRRRSPASVPRRFSSRRIAPNADFLATPAHAQNLTQQAQQLPQHPVGFADIVEKVKPAVISVRVKMERQERLTGSSKDELPFPPGSPFERFFRRFGMPQ